MLFKNRKNPDTKVLILLPTRELANQCFKVTEKMSKYTDITSCLIVGGIPLKDQSQSLKNKPGKKLKLKSI
jgi:ATP-dependent RNA helicase DDX27